MSATEISTQGDHRIAVLQGGSEIAEAMRVNLSMGGELNPSMLTRVSMPTGGATSWSFVDHGNAVSEKELTGVPVFMSPQYTLWPTQEPSGLGPVLVGVDHTTLYRVSDEIGDLDPALLEEARTGDRTYSLERLAYAKAGSGKDGRGRRIKEGRLICLLRPDDAWPIVIKASTMSVRPWNEFVMTLPVPFYQAICSLSLVREKNAAGQPYSRIDAKLVGRLTADEGRQLNATYGEAMRKMLCSFAG